MNTKQVIRRVIQLHILYVYCSLLALAVKYRFNIHQTILGVVSEFWLTWLFVFLSVLTFLVIKGAEKYDGLIDTPSNRMARMTWNGIFCVLLGTLFTTLFLVFVDSFFNQ